MKARAFFHLILSGILLILCSGIDTINAEEPFAGWVSVRTEHFTIIYEKRDVRAAEELIACAEDVYDAVTSYFGTYPEHAVVILDGRTDYANGSFSMPPNRIMLNVASPSTGFEGNRTGDWFRFVFTHEFTHFVHLTDGRGPIGFAAAVFGEMLLNGAGFFMPGWMVEGIATDRETAFTEGGRGRSAPFELTWKAPLPEGKLFSYGQAAYPSDYPPAGRIYTAGYMLVNYLNTTYGDDAFARIHREFTAFPFFGIGGAVRKITGKSPENIFDDMKAFYLEKIGDSAGLPEGIRVSPDVWGNYYSPVAAGNGLYAYRSTFDEPAAVVRIDQRTGKEETVSAGRLFDPASFSVDDGEKLLAFASATSDYTHPAGEEIISDLYLKDLPSGTVRRLTRGAHLFQPALSPDGKRLAAVRREGSYRRLVEVDMETGESAILYGPDGTQIANPAFSPDGRRMAFTANIGGMQDIMILEFGPGADTRIFPLFTTDFAGDFNPRWKDADTVYFASDREGDLFLYEADIPADDPGTGSRITRVLRDPVGILSGVPEEDGILYAGYSSHGYVLKKAGPGMMERVPVAFGSDPLPSYRMPAQVDGEAPYGDPPRIFLHYPFLAISRHIDSEGREGYDFGANFNLSGGSYLGRYGFSSSVSYFPGTGQAGATARLSANLMPFVLGWTFSQSYGADHYIDHFYADTYNQASVRFVLSDSADQAHYGYLSLTSWIDHLYERRALTPFTFIEQFGTGGLSDVHLVSFGTGLSFALSSLNSVPGIDFFRHGVSGTLTATVPLWYSPGPARGMRMDSTLEGTISGGFPHSFLKVGITGLYQPVDFPYPGQLQVRGFTSDVMIGEQVTVASVAALDWIYQFPPLDLPLPFGFSLTGLLTGVHLEWGNGFGPSGFVAGRYLFAGLDANIRISVSSFSAQFLGAGIAARIDLRNPGAFFIKPEFRPYFYLGIMGIGSAAKNGVQVHAGTHVK